MIYSEDHKMTHSQSSSIIANGTNSSRDFFFFFFQIPLNFYAKAIVS